MSNYEKTLPYNLDNPTVIYKDYSQLEISYKNIMDEALIYRESKEEQIEEAGN